MAEFRQFCRRPEAPSSSSFHFANSSEILKISKVGHKTQREVKQVIACLHQWRKIFTGINFLKYNRKQEMISRQGLMLRLLRYVPLYYRQLAPTPQGNQANRNSLQQPCAFHSCCHSQGNEANQSKQLWSGFRTFCSFSPEVNLIYILAHKNIYKAILSSA